MLKKAGSLFTTAYLVLIFGIYPFYMREGYVDIGEAKFRFFIYCSLAAAAILSVTGALCKSAAVRERCRRREPYLIDWAGLSVTDLLVILYSTEVFLSFVLSDYRKEALWGTEGWYMGLVLQLTLCGLYFLVSRFWDRGKLVWYAAMAASGAVFGLGILDRFSLYLIPLEVRHPSFISTLGNINWFCGYLSVLACVGICRFLFWDQWNGCEEEKKRNGGWGRWLCGAYTATAFMAGFSQGSESVFLFFAALFYILLWISIKRKEWFKDYFLLISIWGFSAQAIRFMRFLIPEGYNYDRDSLCSYMTDSNLTLVTGILAFLIYILLWRRQRGGQQKSTEEILVRRVHGFMLSVLGAGVFLWLVLSWLNTRGIIFLPVGGNLFLLDEAWGHGRGAALKAGFTMYGRMPFLNKVAGIGPDCFSAYAYSLPDLAMTLRDSFGSSRLTNAHNELLTCLVNTGAAGTILYMGILISLAVRSLKKGLKEPIGNMAAVCIFCYLVHNMVSFSQVLNLPFLFLIMGMAERVNRSERQCAG